MSRQPERRRARPFRYIWRGRSAWFALMLASVLVQAQQRPDAGQVLEQTREPLRFPPPEEPVLPKPPEPQAGAMASTPQLRVKVESSPSAATRSIRKRCCRSVVEEFLGKELDFEGLNEAATKVRAYLPSRGYFLAQAYLPQQTIRNGGSRSASSKDAWEMWSSTGARARAFPRVCSAAFCDAHLKQGQVITETGLERPLLIINDLPGAQVTSEIRPSRTVGAADLRINVSEEGGRLNGYRRCRQPGQPVYRRIPRRRQPELEHTARLRRPGDVRGFVSDEGMWYTRFAYLIPVGYLRHASRRQLLQVRVRLTKDFAT